MPFLRVIRDKRGYETTYLIHWYRDGTRQRSRILYIFRTPGGVRVGREPLDPEVRRDIEAHHPEIDFDWKTVIDTRQVIETAPKPRWPRKRRESEDARPPAAEVSASGPPDTRPREDPPSPGLARARPAAAAPPPAPPVPSAIEGSTPAEQIAFLALWYPIVRDRIPRRTSDPVRREALLALAERLNPAAWTDADEIVAGLPRAAEALERLSRVFSRRRRRSRRASTRSTSGASAAIGVEPPAVGVVEAPGVSAVEPPVVSAVERPAVSAVEAPAVSAVEAPAVSAVEAPAVSAVEAPAVSAVEPSPGAEGSAQDGSAPGGASTDTTSADE